MWLVILLSAPLASFGEEPGNARRGSADRPTRSALIGIAGAALGVERADAEGQRRLAASLLTATRTLDPGVPLTDFHTFQSLPAARGRVATRADAIARRDDLETSITRRDYRSGGRWQAAYFARPDGTLAVQDLRQAFGRPRFVLYAGRKSCPLDHPLEPTLHETADVRAAFAAHAEALRLERRSGPIAVDERAPQPPDNAKARRHRRDDDPGDRLRWHFSARFERIYGWSEP